MKPECDELIRHVDSAEEPFVDARVEEDGQTLHLSEREGRAKGACSKSSRPLKIGYQTRLCWRSFPGWTLASA